jgi:hypothetical protein
MNSNANLDIGVGTTVSEWKDAGVASWSYVVEIASSAELKSAFDVANGELSAFQTVSLGDRQWKGYKTSKYRLYYQSINHYQSLLPSCACEVHRALASSPLPRRAGVLSLAHSSIDSGWPRLALTCPLTHVSIHKPWRISVFSCKVHIRTRVAHLSMFNRASGCKQAF